LVGYQTVTVSDGSGGNSCDPNYYMSKVNTGANHYKIRIEDPCDSNNLDLDYIVVPYEVKIQIHNFA